LPPFGGCHEKSSFWHVALWRWPFDLTNNSESAEPKLVTN